MGGCRCSYKTCTNTTKTRENLHFFHYPVKHKERCRQWIENANKHQFYDLDEDQLRNKVVCETHFQDYFFPNLQHKRLLQNAIPTLDGDCEPPEPNLEITEVQVLPTNDDNTIFVLETNENQYETEGVESYIYTTNGLVLPINKCNDGSNGSTQNIYQNQDLVQKQRDITDHNTQQDFILHQPPNNVIEEVAKSSILPNVTASPSDGFIIEDKYVKKINQNSRDIALLKRLLKNKKSCYKKPTIGLILSSLKKQLPPSLMNLVNLHLNPQYKLSDEDKEFYTTIYNESPQVYDFLSQKYKWKIPSSANILKKNHGAN